MTITTINRPGRLPPAHSALLSRILWMDLARLVAAAWVVTIHVAAVPVRNIKEVPADWWLWANLYESLSQAAVPLFIMLSGASLLTQDPTGCSTSLGT